MGDRRTMKDKLKWKIQRFKQGYSDCDAWSIRDWFLLTTPKLLDEMRENAHGYPAYKTPEEWDDILRQMAFCFREAHEDTCSQKNEYDDLFDITFKRNDNGTYSTQVTNEEMREKWLAREQEINDYMVQKLAEGLDLFKEYFWDLWD